ncbi:hypothetical protein BC940DRAFT_288406 [Gongronella butleri]|nr:hypothetical protein BC940DRAFT_288406 [Gongronella butleri]
MASSRFTRHLYTASLFFLILLTAACVGLSAIDIIFQSLSDRAPSGSFDIRSLAVVGASYVALAIACFLLASSRLIQIRRTLRKIPKNLVPSGYLPQKVIGRIQQGFNMVSFIRKEAEPLVQDIPDVGWAKPGSGTFEGVNFKQAIARTPTIIEKAAIQISDGYARPSFLPVRNYMEVLMQHDVISVSLGQVYLQGYEKSRFGQHAPTQEEYLDVMKHLAAILRQMGYHQIQQQQHSHHHHPPAATSSDPDASSTTSYDSGRSHASNSRPRHYPSTIDRTYSYSPDDDDVASLAQSVATWSSRSTHRHQPRASPNPDDPRLPSSSNFMDDTDNADYDDTMHQVIYGRLMQPRPS